MPKPKYVTCPNGHRNDRTGGRRKCSFPDCGATLPKRRVPKHAETLRDDSYAHFAWVNQTIHDAGEDCGVCGKPPKFERRHDRDHDHLTGFPRGLACPGNQGCNGLMPRWLTAERAQAIADYLRRVEQHYALYGPPGGFGE